MAEYRRPRSPADHPSEARLGTSWLEQPLPRWLMLLGLAAVLAAAASCDAADGNRLVYLDTTDPYYVGLPSPRFVTPQWVGEPGVEAVVVLAIDDMRGPEKWEAFLRPILECLKRIDGRAPLSIMTCQVDPKHPHLQKWLQEGVSLEVHTVDHPCPLLREGDIAAAKSTYDRCVEMMNDVPGNRAVAFRTPCCDSLNTVSPRFFAEIFNQRSPRGEFLNLDSSVFMVLTPDDPALPRELVVNPDGTSRFGRYVPFPSFVNTIENYPYPYVIGRLCWEFPCIAPSDWSAQHVQKPANPRTVDDLEAAIDAVVIKQGVFNLVFHPYDWIRKEQVVDLIDRTVRKHGSKVKFLSFKEAHERLVQHALSGVPLRAPDGSDNGVRLLDLNADGYMDVVIGNEQVQKNRLWNPGEKRWAESSFPTELVKAGPQGEAIDQGVKFGIWDANGRVGCLVRNDQRSGAWRFDGANWVAEPERFNGLKIDEVPLATSKAGRDRGVRFIDADRDGVCELLVANDSQHARFAWDAAGKAWKRQPHDPPEGAQFVDAEGRDAGLRLVDIDDDQHLDLLWSNTAQYGLHLYQLADGGWTQKVMAGRRSGSDRIPLISRAGTNNGVWFHSRTMWVQNEDTARLPDLVDRRSFNQLLADVEPQPRSPEAALATMRTRPGFRVELAAAEPLVMDPVGLDWGPDGRLWVIEMGDYPTGLDGRGKPGGRVRVLEDVDGDARYDRSTLFYEGLRFPTGIMSWRRGVLVSCSPDILYLEDTDGDGIADRRDVLFTGFAQGNPQHRVNGFARGLDNWLYLANGHSGGKIRASSGGAEVNISGQDVRIKPDEMLVDAQSGTTQFLRSRDDWGHWFGSSNIEPMFQFVLADQYLRRNPYIAFPTGRIDVPENPGTAPVFARSRTLARFNDLHTADRFTSACSAIIYRDELFGPGFSGNSFVSEPVHNLVHREVLTKRGLTYRSTRPEDEQHSEFLASTDSWFRPTMLQTGPDGALWIADMYRLVIEHPEWIPAAQAKKLDLRAGSDKGRIWRVVPVGIPTRPIPKLGELDTVGLVAVLESPNGWQRDKTQELLIERRDAAATEPLRIMVARGARATARLHALCTLDGLDALTVDELTRALKDAHPAVRAHAIRLSQAQVVNSADLQQAVLSMVGDPDPDVRLQLGYRLGTCEGDAAGRALAKLAIANVSDPLILAAAASSFVPHLEALVEAVLAMAAEKDPPLQIVTSLMDVAAGANDDRQLGRLLTAISTDSGGQYAPWKVAAFVSLLDTFDRRGLSLRQFAGGDSTDSLAAGLRSLTEQARATANNPSAQEDQRIVAVGVLGRGLDPRPEDLDALCGLIDPQHSREVQLAAISALSRLDDQPVAKRIVGLWRGSSPALRSELLDILFSRDAWLTDCLDGIEQGQIMPAELDAARRQRLLSHRTAEIRQRATKLLASPLDTDRRKVIEQYQSVSDLTPDRARGRTLFESKCGVCHRLGGKGFAVGPDLAALTDKSAAALLDAILDPNRAIEAQYLNYVALTRDGLTPSGLLASETGNSVTLMTQEAKQQVILRTDLESLESTGKSLMPEGLEKDLTPQDMADVIAYVQGNELPPKQVVGNQPEIVRAVALRDELSCLPSNAEIYGDTLRIEEVNGALGWWNSANDHVVWSIEVDRPTTFDVYFEWSCDPEAAGNTFLLEVAGQRLTGTVAATADWNTYQRQRVGKLRLEAGQHRLGLRANGPIREALFDLKSITLRPEGRF